MQSGDTLPGIIIVTHLINVFCILILIRSGLKILADHPMLYWTDHTRRDNYWLKFGKKQMPKDKLWTAHDEVEDIGQYALPGGGHNVFGASRNWHFSAAIIWMITGAVYYGYLFTTGAWRRLLPTSWGVLPQAWQTFLQYITFHVPPVTSFQPYDALQQLVYAGVVFVLGPLMILTALAMSPAFTGRFPRYLWIFGGRRQAARSLHFIGMVAFSLFILIHITLVFLVYFYRNVRLITLGNTSANLPLALTLFSAALILLLAFNVWATFFTLRSPLKLRRLLVPFITPFIRTAFGRLKSRQNYTRADISPFFRINGYPPKTDEYARLRDAGFRDWRLTVSGLVETPLELTLDQLKQLPKQEQITKHICIQGWSAVGQWGGVHMREIMKLCRPAKQAKYVVFYAHDVDDAGAPFYEALRLDDMKDPQTILAYEMNWEQLSVEHGAPLRLRCERKLGYKMAKYLRAIEFTDSFEHIGQGRGGYREDTVLFDWEASI